MQEKSAFVKKIFQRASVDLGFLGQKDLAIFLKLSPASISSMISRGKITKTAVMKFLQNLDKLSFGTIVRLKLISEDEINLTTSFENGFEIISGFDFLGNIYLYPFPTFKLEIYNQILEDSTYELNDDILGYRMTYNSFAEKVKYNANLEKVKDNWEKENLERIENLVLGDRLKQFIIDIYGSFNDFLDVFSDDQTLIDDFLHDPKKPSNEVLARLYEIGCNINWLLSGHGEMWNETEAGRTLRDKHSKKIVTADENKAKKK